ncbi:TPA: hypothetical protein DIV55_03030 [Patescibacteria group bacterium]|nr:hypothetical protein [Patescibacteria group bacterium]
MHAGTLSQSAQTALAILGNSEILKDAYLAGGSALALHLGHRKSYDFDFYTRNDLPAADVASQLAKIGNFQTTLLEPPHTVLGLFNDVKFSLFRYDYPLLNELQQFNGIGFASIPDIATMKLSAICGRATKRDYIDLFFISKQYSFEQLIEFFKQKFGKLGNNLYFILKSLSYFEDAEADELPQMLTPVSWDKVKQFFVSESMRLARKYLEE